MRRWGRGSFGRSGDLAVTVACYEPPDGGSRPRPARCGATRCRDEEAGFRLAEARVLVAAQHFRFSGAPAALLCAGQTSSSHCSVIGVSIGFGDAQVAIRASRAYKMKLSPRGITLFLDCHTRLCGLVGDLLPYGATLRVAVALLERLPLEEVAAEITCGELDGFAGKDAHFVGAPLQLAAVASALADRVGRHHQVGSTPQNATIYLAALSAMREATDMEISQAYYSLGAADEQEYRTG